MPDWINLETLAVGFSLAYVALAIRQHPWCWYCAFAGTAIYVWIFGGVDLYMQSLLNIYYMGMAVYGWCQWRRGGEHHQGVAIRRWHPRQHLAALGAIAVATLLSGYLLEEYQQTRLAYLDAFITWASVLTTWLVARKILENWLYWMVIDACGIYLFLDRELYQTVVLFVIYIVMAVIGYRQWLRDMHPQCDNEAGRDA